MKVIVNTVIKMLPKKEMKRELTEKVHILKKILHELAVS